MTVYIEYVLIDNFLIDYMLINLTLTTLNLSVKKWKVALSSFLGSVFALLYPLFNFHKVVNGILKLLLGLVLVSLVVPKISARKIYVTYLFFLIFTFTLGGVLIGFYEIFALDYTAEISTAIAFLPCYIVIRFIRSLLNYLRQKKTTESYCVNTEILVGEKRILAKGLLDSGNGAYKESLPVIFLSHKKASVFFDNVDFYKKLEKIKIQTVNGEKDKLCFKADIIRIYSMDKINIFNNVAVCLIKTTNDYDVILHSSMIMGGENESDKDIIKAS